MFRRFWHGDARKPRLRGKKHRFTHAEVAALEDAFAEEARRQKEAEQHALDAAREERAAREEAARAEDAARKDAAMDARVVGKIKELKESIAAADASAQDFAAQCDDLLALAARAKENAEEPEAQRLIREARRVEQRLNLTKERKRKYLEQIDALTEARENKGKLDQTTRFITAIRKAESAYLAREQDAPSGTNTNSPQDATVQFLTDAETKIREGVEQVETLLEKKTDILRKALENKRRKREDQVNLGLIMSEVNTINRKVERVNLNISILTKQSVALSQSVNQGDQSRHIHEFIEIANSVTPIFKRAAAVSSDAMHDSDVSNSALNSLKESEDTAELHARLSNALVGTHRRFDAVEDKRRRLNTDMERLMAEAYKYKQEGKTERAKLALLQRNAAKELSVTLDSAVSLLVRQDRLTDLTCVLLEVLRSRHDFQLLIAMTNSPCIEAKGTEVLSGAIVTDDEERMRKAIAENDQNLTNVSQGIAQFEMKRRLLVTEAIAMRQESKSMMTSQVRDIVATARLADDKSHVRTEQYVKLLSERCCMEQRIEERRLACTFHVLSSEASTLPVVDDPYSDESAVEHIQRIGSIGAKACKVLEMETERMAKKKQELEESKEQVYQLMSERLGFDGLASAAHYAVLNKRILWYSGKMRDLEEYADDFEHWTFQLWSHFVTKEFHSWVSKYEKESKSTDESDMHLPNERESQLQSRLATKMDMIRGLQLNLKEELKGISNIATACPISFVRAEKRKRCTVKLSILAAQHNLLSSMLVKRKGPIQVLFRGHVHQSPIVNPENFVAALEESSSLTFHDVLFAHKLVSFLMRKRAVFSPPFDDAEARRMFLMRKLYGNLVDQTLTEGQSVLVRDMLHFAQKDEILSADNVTSLLLTLRLKGNFERRFLQLADVIDDIYRDVAGRLLVVETQLASVETALYRVKQSQDKGKRVAMWASLVKFGLSMIPIAGQVAAAGVDMAVQSTEVISELFFSESSMEIAGAFQDFVSSAGQFAVDAFVIENGGKLPDSVKENIAAAKLGRICLSAEFRDRLPSEYRERLVSTAESSWGASIDVVECDFDKIIESFKEETDARAFEVDEDDLYGADVFVEVMRTEEANLAATEDDISVGEVLSEGSEYDSDENDGGEDYSGDDSIMKKISSQLLEEAHELQRMALAADVTHKTKGSDRLHFVANPSAGRYTAEKDARNFEDELIENKIMQLHGSGMMEKNGDWLEATILHGAGEERISLMSKEASCGPETGANSLSRATMTTFASDWVEAFKRELQTSETVKIGKLFHDDAVNCARSLLSHDVDWLPDEYVEDAFLSVNTDRSFRVDEEQFVRALKKVHEAIEAERSAAISMHWAKLFCSAAPPKTGLINTTLAKHLLRDLGVDVEGLGAEVDAIVGKFAVGRKVNLARFGHIWKSLQPSATES